MEVKFLPANLHNKYDHISNKYGIPFYNLTLYSLQILSNNPYSKSISWGLAAICNPSRRRSFLSFPSGKYTGNIEIVYVPRVIKLDWLAYAHRLILGL